jgi:hypothetical protein
VGKIADSKRNKHFISLVMLLRVIIDFVVDYLKCHLPSLIARCYSFFGLTLEEKVG